MLVRIRATFFAATVVLAACSGAPAQTVTTQPATAAYDPKTLPAGPVGEAIAYGHAIILDTPRLMKPYVRAQMSCGACHIAAGTQPRGGSFIGLYGRFPQWNKRAHRVIALQDRIAECFLYSMNGKAPAYSSKAMIAIVAYIAWLSRGVPVGAKQPQDDRYIVPLPKVAANVGDGAKIYASKCSICHQANGSGISAAGFPPLWGAHSFNGGAGMAHADRMTGFIRYNMPQNAPGSLSLSESYDVAAFVLSHARPRFAKNASVVTGALPAKYF
ncbi:MAG: c-type cytochrome [Candidatus Cybelea sp.]|jgi:thiosulfate dehydrogenase